MDEREMQDLLQRAMEEIRTLGSVSDETAQKLKEAADESATFKKSLKQAAGEVTKSMGRLALTMGHGNQDFTQFNAIVDTTANAISKMGQAVPFFGAAVIAAAEGAKFLVGQLQATVATFNKVSESGLIGAEGMTGLRNQAIESGISLDVFSRAITNNSEALARFGGTATDGAQKFSRALGQVNRQFGEPLMRLGMSFDSIAESTAGYIALQTRLGNAQRMSQDQLAKGAFEYAKQMDELAKLTGQQKADLQKQRDAMMSEARFRAKLQELESQGRGDLARKFEQLALMMPELGPGLRDLIASGGVATTEAAREIMFSTNSAVLKVIQDMESGVNQNVQANAMAMQAGAREFDRSYQGLIKFTGDMPGFVSNFAKIADLAARDFGRVGQAAGTIEKQMGPSDALTDATVKAQKSMMSFTNAMDQVVIQLLPNAASVVSKFAGTMDEALRKIAEETGVPITPLPKYAQGGITDGPSIAGEAGPEAVVPLPDGKTIPVDIRLDAPAAPDQSQAADPRTVAPPQPAQPQPMDIRQKIMDMPYDESMKGMRIGGLGVDGSYQAGPISTDTKLTDMIMQRLGLDDIQSQRMINLSGIGMNYNMAGADFGSAIGGGAARDDIADRVADLVESGQPLQEALQTTLTEFQAALAELVKSRGGANEGENMAALMAQLVELQRSNNSTSERILQAANN